MNRTIKFRGKRVDGKGWVYGTPVYYISGEVSLFTGLCPKVGYEATRISAMRNQVIPETVSQFTGRKDINNVDVYDGSIIKNEDSGELQEVFWNNEKSAWYCRYLDDNYIVSLTDSLGNLNFITGNIHDND